jgi:hypothetical protein
LRRTGRKHKPSTRLLSYTNEIVQRSTKRKKIRLSAGEFDSEAVSSIHTEPTEDDNIINTHRKLFGSDDNDLRLVPGGSMC